MAFNYYLTPTGPGNVKQFTTSPQAAALLMLNISDTVKDITTANIKAVQAAEDPTQDKAEYNKVVNSIFNHTATIKSINR